MEYVVWLWPSLGGHSKISSKISLAVQIFIWHFLNTWYYKVKIIKIKTINIFPRKFMGEIRKFKVVDLFKCYKLLSRVFQKYS